MSPGVIPDEEPGPDLGPDVVGRFALLLPDVEEGGTHAICLENRDDLGRARARSVVECQRHCLAAIWDGRGIEVRAVRRCRAPCSRWHGRRRCGRARSRRGGGASRACGRRGGSPRGARPATGQDLAPSATSEKEDKNHYRRRARLHGIPPWLRTIMRRYEHRWPEAKDPAPRGVSSRGLCAALVPRTVCR